jgi:hypothetical protein
MNLNIKVLLFILLFIVLAEITVRIFTDKICFMVECLKKG